jgi:hypothetical protein
MLKKALALTNTWSELLGLAAEKHKARPFFLQGLCQFGRACDNVPIPQIFMPKAYHVARDRDSARRPFRISLHSGALPLWMQMLI